MNRAFIELQNEILLPVKIQNSLKSEKVYKCLNIQGNSVWNKIMNCMLWRNSVIKTLNKEDYLDNLELRIVFW